MMKVCLAAAAAFGLMTGVALAQSSTTSTTSTTSSPSVAPPVYYAPTAHSSERTTTNDGVVTDKTKTYTSGTGIAPSGELSATHTKSETTTVR
jgi:hypothetical protein